ncbi:MAG: hypothetical protein M1822_007210 [Bathelium mastoideum]|nr:MAG: hypothetical protein M1822_007210 [Bathelium mastoideum]
MSTYVITGASKGIGFAFLDQISRDSKNLIVGLVRDKPGTEKKVAAELNSRSNIHILHGDLTNYASLRQAATDTAKLVGERGVDYVIANGALVPQFDAYGPIGSLADKPEELEKISSQLFQTNVVGNIHLFNLFIPLVLKGKVKKVIAISSGHADLDFINNHEIEVGPLYAMSKAALNVAVAKFNAQYKKDGVLFMSISPGVIDVGHTEEITPEQMQGMQGFFAKIQAYTPYFKGPSTPEQALPIVKDTWERASVQTGYGGAFVSHFGNKQWL